MAKQKFFVNEDELDSYQIQLLQKRIDQSMVVSGCAGSGKSILALWKAKQIQEMLDGSTYKFIVFTKALHQYMSDGIKEVGLKSENFTYHWAWVDAGCPPADYIIVDEIQDFTKEEIAQFKTAAQKEFFFWGDSKQSIYKGLKKTQTILEIAYESNIQSEQLMFNHRLPKTIARFSAQIINDCELESRCRREGADLPKVLKHGSLEKQLDFAMDIINNRNITDSAILFSHNEEVEKAFNYLEESGHNVEAKFRREMTLDFTSDNPKIMTYHSAKGLQFEAVFMPECSSDKSDDRNSLYVAMTRSYEYLYIMYSDALSPFFDSIPTNLCETSITDDIDEL